jgi:hypothetical protein
MNLSLGKPGHSAFRFSILLANYVYFNKLTIAPGLTLLLKYERNNLIF